MSHRRKRNLERKRAKEEEEWKRKTTRMLLLQGVSRQEVDRVVEAGDPRSVVERMNAVGLSIDYADIVRVKDKEFHLFLPTDTDPPVHLFAISVADACRALDANPHVSLANQRYVVIGAPILGDLASGMTSLLQHDARRFSSLQRASPKVAERFDNSHAWAKDGPWILISFGVFSMHMVGNGPRFAVYDLVDTIHHEALHADGVPHNPDLVKRLNDACRWTARGIADSMPDSMDRGPTPFMGLVEEHLELQARFVDEEANEAFRAEQIRTLEALWDNL